VGGFWALGCVANFFLGQSIGIDENNWALEWAWQIFSRLVGVKVGVANQSIGIDETNTIQLKLFV